MRLWGGAVGRAVGLGVLLAAWLGGAGPSSAKDFVLAATWQPAFCESYQDKPECMSQTAERFDATHLALHGLWPQPRGNNYCGVADDVLADDKARRWEKLAPLGLSSGTFTTLTKVMPGTQSFLHRHEWVKHGTCTGLSVEAYYRASLRLLAQVNRSEVRRVLAGKIGKLVMARDIRAAFDQAFGAGAGQRVSVTCRKDGARWLLVELRLHVRGDVTGPIRGKADMSKLLLAAEPVSMGRAECGVLTIDPVGYQ